MLKIQFKDRRKPAMWLVASTIKIGSDTSCDIVIAESNVDPFHVELVIQQDEILLRNTSNQRSVFINEIPVVKEHSLKAWDLIKIGNSELEIIDPLTERHPPPSAPVPDQATVIRPVVGPWMLKAESVPLDGQYFSVSDGFVVGRDEKADIKLPFNYVSRNHLKIIIRDDQLMIKDLDSSNGTYLNGKRIKNMKAHNGDELRVDQFIFRVIGPSSDTHVKTNTIINKKAELKSEKKESPVIAKPKKVMANQKAFLHGLSPEVQAQVYEIGKAENHVSRMLGHHLSTAEISVSARHVYLNETDLGWEIKNNGASDGLLVNGNMQSRVILQDGDELVIGGTLLKFQCVGEAPRNYVKPVVKKTNQGKLVFVIILLALTATGLYFSGLLS